MGKSHLGKPHLGKPHLLDANAVIDYVGDKLPPVVKIEVLGFDGDPADMEKLGNFFALSTTFYVDEEIANKTIDLRKAHKKRKLGDAIIAATALVHGFVIVSRNTKDFQPIAGLHCINPYELV